MADVLLGRVAPSGRLPVTWCVLLEMCSCFSGQHGQTFRGGWQWHDSFEQLPAPLPLQVQGVVPHGSIHVGHADAGFPWIPGYAGCC